MSGMKVSESEIFVMACECMASISFGIWMGRQSAGFFVFFMLVLVHEAIDGYATWKEVGPKNG